MKLIERDVEDVKINAREVSIPAQNAFLHSSFNIIMWMDQNGVLKPDRDAWAKIGSRLSYIIHGVRTRIQKYHPPV